MAHPSRLPRPVSQLNLQGQAELCSFSARETITGEGVTVKESPAVFSAASNPVQFQGRACLEAAGRLGGPKGGQERPPRPPKLACLDSVLSNCMLRGNVIRFVF